MPFVQQKIYEITLKIKENKQGSFVGQIHSSRKSPITFTWNNLLVYLHCFSCQSVTLAFGCSLKQGICFQRRRWDVAWLSGSKFFTIKLFWIQQEAGFYHRMWCFLLSWLLVRKCNSPDLKSLWPTPGRQSGGWAVRSDHLVNAVQGCVCLLTGCALIGQKIWKCKLSGLSL